MQQYIDAYTKRMNTKYGLNEETWPNFFGLADHTVMMQYVWCSTHPQEDETPDQRHARERKIFALWHEIESRGLISAENVALGTHIWPWENQIVYPPTPSEYLAMTEQERWDHFMDGIDGYGNTALGFSPGRQRKIGKGRIEDEEMLGIYRRERND